MMRHQIIYCGCPSTMDGFTVLRTIAGNNALPSPGFLYGAGRATQGKK
ncbi:hypothetical protein [Coxiella burnetii]|nr:hypothetical protein [Coxiella burnetii]ACJ18433.1 hypothetical protein CbuG_1093 [Coxiella burnetii CbuG_Q212]OYK86137.1 hypothetical protein CbuQ229_05520 [Coxiella burnetii]